MLKKQDEILKKHDVSISLLGEVYRKWILCSRKMTRQLQQFGRFPQSLIELMNCAKVETGNRGGSCQKSQEA